MNEFTGSCNRMHAVAHPCEQMVTDTQKSMHAWHAHYDFGMLQEACTPGLILYAGVDNGSNGSSEGNTSSFSH